MTSARRALWLPSLFVGAAAAIAVATAAALLLYDSEGLVRAGAVLAGVTVFSLVAGLWTGMGDPDQESIPSAARWWVAFLVALLVGAGFAAMWEALDGFRAAPVAQGVGLALTTALPTYFAGGVWGRIGSFAETLGAGLKRRVAVGAVAGVAGGSVLVFTILGRPVLAVTAFLGAAIFASLGARTQGWIFDRVPRRRLLLREPRRPELRFEVWHTSHPDSTLRVLVDTGQDRTVDPPRTGSWQAGVASMLVGTGPVLFVGCRSWVRVEAGREWAVFEPDPEVKRLATRGFGWEEASFAPSAVPEHPGVTVVVERRGLGELIPPSRSVEDLLKALKEARVERAWIGGGRGPVPDDLTDSGVVAGFRVGHYSGTVERDPGPPGFPPRWDELWCFDPTSSPPEAIPGMRTLTRESPVEESPR